MLRKTILAALLFLLVISITSAEITVNQFPQDNGNDHTFIVNTYTPTGNSLPDNTLPNNNLPPSTNTLPYPTNPSPDAAVPQASTGVSIAIEQQKSVQVIAPCGEANFSFKITNQENAQKVYDLSVTDFSGTAYLTPNLLLNPMESKIVDFTLVPDCSSNKVLNPLIHIETDDEMADMPVIININGTYIDPDNCNYYYNSTVCDSPFYLRVAKDSPYNVDLSKWFYDPDSDNLQYTSSKPANLNIVINGNTAKIEPAADWLGTEAVDFTASDGKGGKAISKTFYIHVVSGNNGNGSFLNKLLNILGF